MTVQGRKLPDGYVLLPTKDGKYDVAIGPKAAKELSKASVDQRTELEDLVKRYAADGPSALPRNKMKDQGWHPGAKANKKVRVEAFKAWQLRAYGFCRDFKGRPTFFITGVDRSKKQNDANDAILEAAGKEALRVHNELG